MNKFKKIFIDILFVSKLTNVNKKKIRILFTIITSNLVVAVDLGIIVFFATLFTGKINYQNKFIVSTLNFLLENKIFLLIIVIFRFLLIILERFNIYYLQIQVERNLKYHVMNEIYNRGNYSIADTYFYVNTLTAHLGFFYGAITSSSNSFLQIIGYLIFLIFSNSDVMLYFIFGIIIIYFPTKYLILKAREYMDKQFNYSKTLSYNIQRIVENIFLIKILKTWKNESVYYAQNLDQNKKSQALNNLYGTINALIPNTLTLLIIVILSNIFDITEILTLEFIAVILRLFQSIGGLTNSINMAVNSHVHIEKLSEFEINNKSKIPLNYFIKTMDAYAVEIQNIDFKYINSSENIFENLSIKVEKNKHTILTGPNGSGKSTILGIISGIYQPNNGKVVIGSEKLGYIGVTPLIIEGSLKENLLYGNNLNISDDKIFDLINLFQVFSGTESIDLNKSINNKTLSSGQMQKISFIRALLNEVDILLLDESTSNLDVNTKKLIFDILKKEKITIINSTHSKEDFEYDHEISITYNENKKRVATLLSKDN